MAASFRISVRYASAAERVILRALASGIPDARGRHDDAGGQPLDVPLEWCRVGLIEVVEIEAQASLRRGEHAEAR